MTGHHANQTGLLSAILMTALLTACTLTTAAKDPEPATLSITDAPPPAIYRVIRFSAGARAGADLVQLDVRGLGIRVNDVRCSAVTGGITCKFNPALYIPAGKSFALPIQGADLRASALYIRDGVRYQTK